MTTLDLSTLSPKARERYIRLGRRFGSDDTLEQANKTLEALATHANTLVEYGFGADDTSRLTAARDALSAAGVGRESKATEKKVTRKEYLAAVSQAKSTRRTARTILENTLVILEDNGDDDSVRQIESTLSQSNSLPMAGQDEALAIQLDLLAAVFANTAIATTTQSRGGEKALAHLQEAATSLRSAAEDRQISGTQLSTEDMDLLDGIIVTLCRAARNAAKQAARASGSPALLALFAVPHITQKHGHETQEPVQTPATPVTTPATP